MKYEAKGLIFWAPRVLSILFILFLALFSFDIFEMQLGFWGTLLGLLMHNIPSIILTIILIIAWKHELVGAVAFIAAGSLYTLMLMANLLRGSFHFYMLSWLAVIAGPAFLAGGLFLIGWLRKGADSRKRSSRSKAAK